MTSLKRASIAVFAGLALVSCQTITEELPSAPTTPTNVVPSIPVVVVPVPVPVPAPAPAPLPNPAPTTPTTQPRNPNPNPTPRPPAPPANPGNTGSTVRIGAKVYFVERDGQIVPGTDGATEALVGDRVHLDATAKDAQNLPTTTNGPPRWTYSDPGLVSISGGNADWTPVMLVRRPGVMSLYVEADGVRSNTVTISFR
jgi:hypothetical protein